tara:strand:- start:328 stop:582 length:255 start_codon:yes stop_codon:yes gene_type:complete
MLVSAAPFVVSVVGALVTSLMIVKDVEAQSDMAIHRVDVAESRVGRLEEKIDSLMLLTRENHVSLNDLKKDMAEIREDIRGRSR